MKETFAVIGNNWGNKIFNILLSLNFKVVKLNLKSPKRYKNDKSYMYHLNKQLNLIKKDCNIIWIAITPNRDKQFQIVKQCLQKKFHLVIEKPWLVSVNKTKHLEKLQKKNKLLVGFHYEYLYLNFLKKNRLKFKNLANSVVLNFHVNNNKLKRKHKSELGSHLHAIKKYYFPNIKKYQIITGFKKNLRSITVKVEKKILFHNFTINKENIIKKFLKDYLNHLKKNKEFKFDFNFLISD